MSSGLQVDGVSYLPLKEAAALVSYTRDYVARLAREGKIVATRVGRQWLVDPVSLQLFAEQAELEADIRREQLRQLRQREREAAAVQQLQHAELRRHMCTAPRRALAFTLAALACALIGGLAGHSVGLPTMLTSQLIQRAEVRMAVTPVSIPASSAVMETVPETVHVPTVTIMPLSGADGLGVLLLSQDGLVQTAEDVAALFSDPITITRTEDGLATISLEETPEHMGLPVVFLPVAYEGNTEYP